MTGGADRGARLAEPSSSGWQEQWSWLRRALAVVMAAAAVADTAATESRQRDNMMMRDDPLPT